MIVMPALNEAATVGELVRGVSRYGVPLVVDDNSSDETGSIAEAAGARVLKLPSNAGYEGALEAGFAEAARLGADTIVTFDSDGQFEPEVLEDMLRPIRDETADLVIGERKRKARFGEYLFGLYTWMRFGVSDILCGVKAYRIALYTAHGRFSAGRCVGTELALAALRKGARFQTVKLTVRPRRSGRPRFGSGLKANWRLLVAMALAVWADVGLAGR